MLPGLQLGDVEDWVDVGHPLWKISQLIGIIAPACKDSEGTQPSGRKLALAVDYRQISCVQQHFITNVEGKLLVVFVILLFL